MNQDRVRATLFHAVKTQLATMSLASATSWPNRLFKPSGGLWIGVSYLPTNPTPVSLGDNGEDELRGLVQLDVNVPTDTGEAAQLMALASLEEVFIPGVVFKYNSQSVKVLSAARSSGRLVGNDWRVSLSIYFSARYQRSMILMYPNVDPPPILGPPPVFP